MLHFFAKRLSAVHKEEKGFTLIELLVVIVIIGILAAIAVPTYLNQRKQAQNAAAQSDARNAATFQEIYYTDNGYYAASVDNLRTKGFRQSGSVTTTIISPTSETGKPQSYCLSAKHTSSDTIYYASSANPAASTTQCSS